MQLLNLSLIIKNIFLENAECALLINGRVCFLCKTQKINDLYIWILRNCTHAVPYRYVLAIYISLF